MKVKKISIFGLGYVGLPLLIEFSNHYKVVGYDKNEDKINKLKKKFRNKKNILISNNLQDSQLSNIIIVSVPTPILRNKKPDLKPISRACKDIDKILKKNDIVIFESTVYPGLTEEFCVPLLGIKNNLKFNKDFFCGYSPERINPGDNKHTLTNIMKITSGSNVKTANIINKLYKKIIKAGTYKAPSIKIAEAAKVIENAQRDLNIAYINELSLIFDKMNINTNEVLKAANTKWNFLDFKPGLVGGHCIGVDPYYLTYKSKKLGYNPRVILAGRKLNDSIPDYIFKKTKRLMLEKSIRIKNAKILIMGATFKENSDDLRNSKIFEFAKKMNKHTNNIDFYEPNLNIRKYLGFKFINYPKKNYYDCVIISVAHKQIKNIGIKSILSFTKKNNLIFDLKNIFKYNKFFTI